MRTSQVAFAAAAYAKGNYSVALEIYERLGQQLGERLFAANIILCKNKLTGNKLFSKYSDITLQRIKVACVMDEFTYHSYAPECNLFPLTPANVEEELSHFQPDLLFIESAWRGKDELWTRKIGRLSQELRTALSWCKGKKIPTVFWNKEDPVHFETFLTTAQQFDYVFTTDIDCIGRYKAALGHERVFLLPFACQPKSHNPIELYERKDAFCFAGAYYARYPERTRDLENYLLELPQFKVLEIYDRNFGQTDEIYKDYKFPEKFEPHIVGTLPFSDIHKAYKGYRYSINLNSIKQSQSMFARRVYDLLGSNTITVSNFSRGVRTLFGDLVISSDSATEIVNRLKRLSLEDEQKLRLAGLRKVMLEHTYRHRLAYVLSKALGRSADIVLPPMLVVALAQTNNEYRYIIENFNRQSHSDKQLLLLADPRIFQGELQTLPQDNIILVDSVRQANEKITQLLKSSHWLAPMLGADYYGPNYLLDLAVATTYCDTDLVGKASYYQYADFALGLINPKSAYRPAYRLPKRASAVRISALGAEILQDLNWLHNLPTEHWVMQGIAIDPFNYAHNGQFMNSEELTNRVDDLTLNNGLPIEQLLQTAENIAPAEVHDADVPRWSGAKLSDLIKAAHPKIDFQLDGNGLQIHSNLPDEAHHYMYSNTDLPLASLPASKVFLTCLDATPGLDVQYVFVFIDQNNQKISHAIQTANRNNTVSVPDATAAVRLGLRVRGSGNSTISSLQWGHRQIEAKSVVGQGEYLLLTNQYASYDDLYRYGFVHTRVLAYAARGLKVDVFRLRNNQSLSFHEFQNVDCITGSQQELHALLKCGRYRSVLVHFLDPVLWEVLRHYVDRVKIVVWVHGSEIQPWHRRDFNYQTEEERKDARSQSDLRIAFWRGLLQQMPPNLKLVFVSRYFAEEVMEDLGFRLPQEAYTIIHNPIDTDLFSYQPKPIEQRNKVLSIRPFASRVYANDLTVKTILLLASRPCFKDMEFRIIGDGNLFQETVRPILELENVTVERRFLNRTQIADIHKDYGVFLVPTRMDSQGVSRDEAMSSGLVPVTNAVAAVPDFVDSSCGLLAPPEDAFALAAALERLQNDDSLFNRLSQSAAARVRRQSDVAKIINLELQIIGFHVHQ
jgi:spore maturation protein CgeB/glycosyltransferase involved in cell wall biosynthesis